MKYVSTKTFPPLSCAFRQHKAHSHCRFLHGYGIVVRVEFEADTLDAYNWVVDFGSLKSFKGMLEDQFDHKLVLADDDPMLPELMSLDELGLAQVRLMPSVGCEKFAEYIAGAATVWMASNGYGDRCRVRKVEVSEHQFNSAMVMGDFE